MIKEWILNYLAVFAAAAIISYLFGFIIKSFAKSLGIIDNPAEGKLHQTPTPRLGGLAIFLGFSLSLFLSQYILPFGTLGPQRWAIIIGALMTMFVGAMDDLTASRGGVPAAIKLIILFVITYILSQAGIMVNFPFPYLINLIITMTWLVGVTSAFNAMDNMDGLASGLALIASMAYLAIAIQTGQWTWGLISVGLIGANLGFLRHNFYPAKIFMGDSGSFFLGFTLAALGIMGGWSTNPFKASFVPIIILGLPLLDLVYVIYRRYRQGITHGIKEIITYSAQDHFSHRLKALGLSHKQTVILVWLISFCVSCGAFILRNTRKWEAILLLFQFVLIVLIVFIIVSRIAPTREPK
ncbi:MAG: undecaprenyl/decaprenyl-phosphate alpha-N-acetylglucosaminyl 1-phosphate transferase [Planctomycetes bacterium]|nr:undecaprenyl/decaprenyl-phosphate alpha-N-acetylglucosaminyl 1-phosphate transferase [Planctomycetota bacterium]